MLTPPGEHGTQRLRRLYVEAATELAQLHFEQGELERALDCCQLFGRDPV